MVVVVPAGVPTSSAGQTPLYRSLNSSSGGTSPPARANCRRVWTHRPPSQGMTASQPASSQGHVVKGAGTTVNRLGRIGGEGAQSTLMVSMGCSSSSLLALEAAPPASPDRNSESPLLRSSSSSSPVAAAATVRHRSLQNHPSCSAFLQICSKTV